MKRIPDAGLELMMVIWDSDQPVSRMDIETKKVVASGRKHWSDAGAKEYRKITE